MVREDIQRPAVVTGDCAAPFFLRFEIWYNVIHMCLSPSLDGVVVEFGAWGGVHVDHYTDAHSTMMCHEQSSESAKFVPTANCTSFQVLFVPECW